MEQVIKQIAADLRKRYSYGQLETLARYYNIEYYLDDPFSEVVYKIARAIYHQKHLNSN